MKGILFLAILFLFMMLRGEAKAQENRISLPEFQRKGGISVEEAIFQRRSIRSFRDEALTLRELSQLLFAAQGITDEEYGFRAAPSAGALYPLTLYAVVGKVEGLAPGVYRYHPEKHELTGVKEGDQRTALFRVALQQNSVKEAPVILIFTVIYERTTRKYGERGIRYVHMEIGHAAQNVYLQAESLGLGTVAIGAFLDDGVAEVLGLPQNEAPLYLMPVGKPGR